MKIVFTYAALTGWLDGALAARPCRAASFAAIVRGPSDEQTGVTSTHDGPTSLRLLTTRIRPMGSVQ